MISDNKVYIFIFLQHYTDLTNRNGVMQNKSCNEDWSGMITIIVLKRTILESLQVFLRTKVCFQDFLPSIES